MLTCSAWTPRAAVETLGIPCFLGGMARGLLGRSHPLHIRQNRGAALKKADVVVLAGGSQPPRPSSLSPIQAPPHPVIRPLPVRYALASPWCLQRVLNDPEPEIQADSPGCCRGLWPSFVLSAPCAQRAARAVLHVQRLHLCALRSICAAYPYVACLSSPKGLSTLPDT